MDLNTIRKIMSGYEPVIMETRRENAVLLPLIETAEGLSVVYEKRASSIAQGGEVCLPGGMIEDGEAPKDAALRELMEELGLGADSIEEFYGQFDTQITHSRLVQYVFIAKLKGDALTRVKPNPHEVQRVFTIPLEFLVNNPPKVFNFPVEVRPDDDSFYDVMEFEDHRYNWAKGRISVPIWKYDGEILWGITGRIMRRFIEVFNVQNE